MKRLIFILPLIASCTFDYTVGIETTSDKYIQHIELKRDAQFDVCYQNGYMVLGFYSPMVARPKQYTGKNVVGFEIIETNKK